MADPVPLLLEVSLWGLGPFAAGGMLWWGLVALLPILLHLLRRRRSRTVPWGAMQFLQAAIARRARQFQFWRLLLLCLRVAAVAMIAAALARPVLRESAPGAAEPATPRTLRVLVIDTSYSMRTVAGGRSRFEAAQQAAAEVCRSAPRGDGFLLLTMGETPQAIIHNVSLRAEQTVAEIERLAAGEGRADLPATMAAVEAAIDDAVREGWEGPVEVVVFSDLQQATWGPLTPALSPKENRDGADGEGRSTAAVPFGGEGARGKSRYRVWDVADSVPRDNATVGAIERDRSAAGEVGTVAWLSPITHSAGAAIRGRLAQLLVDGHVAQSQSFDLPVGGTQTLLWSARLAPGRHAVEVRIGDDSLAIDNVRRTVVEVSSSLTVAAFGPTAADTRYLALAAAPGGAGPVDVKTFALDELPQTEIGRFDVWVLCDPRPMGGAAAERMEQHLEQGGGIVWWLGPNWRSGAGGEASEENAASPGRGAWRADNVVAVEAQRIDPLGYESPLVGVFEAFPGAGLLSLPVFRYWRLELGDGWQPAVAILPNDPLIAAYAGGAGGRQVLVATPPGPGGSLDSAPAEPWNALIAWPSFVPLVQEIIGWAEAGERGPNHFIVGQSIVGRTDEARMGEELRSESGSVLEVDVRRRSGQSVVWSAGVADRSGFYRWVEGASDDAEGPAIAVNVDPAEGRLQKISELPAPWMPYAGRSAVTADENGSAASEERFWAGASSGGHELFWWVLITALGLLAAESIVVKLLEGRF